MEAQEKEFDLRKLWWVLRKYLLWIVICTILGAVALGVYTTGTSKESYTSTSAFLVKRNGNTSLQGTVYEMSTSIEDARTIVELLKFKDTVKTILEMDGRKVEEEVTKGEETIKVVRDWTDDEIADIQSNLSVQLQTEETPIVILSIRYGDDKGALAIARAFEARLQEFVQKDRGDTFDEETGELIERGGLGMKDTFISIANYAALPTSPDSIPLVRNTLLGGIVMLVVSYLAFFIYDMLDNSVRSKEELLTTFPQLPVVGAIPSWVDPRLTRRQKKLEAKGRLRDYENKLINNKTGFSIVESFRSLRTNVSYMINDKSKVIGVTSVKTGECKSVVSCNLALSYSQLNKKVLLIEGDMRLPSIHEICHISVTNGLPEVIAGIVPDYHDVLVKLNDSLDIMAVGQIPPNPAELLASDATRDLFAKLREEYDLIVLDLPPLGTVADAGVIADVVDQYLLSTRVNNSNSRMIAAILRDMEHLEMKIGGFVISGIEHKNKYSKNPYYYDRYGVRQSSGGYRSYRTVASSTDDKANSKENTEKTNKQ